MQAFLGITARRNLDGCLMISTGILGRTDNFVKWLDVISNVLLNGLPQHSRVLAEIVPSGCLNIRMTSQFLDE